jgi:hypothetical protein
MVAGGSKGGARMKRRALFLTGFIIFLMISPAVYAQGAGSMSSRSGCWNPGLSLGFMVDPDLVGLQLGMDYYITNEIAVGPLLIAAASGDDNLWGMSGQVKYSARLAENEVVRPYGHIGIGFINLAVEQYEEGELDTRALFPVGGGFEFELNDELTLDVNALFIVSDITSVGLFGGLRYLF